MNQRKPVAIRFRLPIFIAAAIGSLLVWLAAGAVVDPDSVSAEVSQTQTVASVDLGVKSTAVRSAALTEPEVIAEPTRLVIDSIATAMNVEPVGVGVDGQMDLPERPDIAGWYRFGPDVLSTAGSIVLAAHVDTRQHGIGPLGRLREVRTGALVQLDSGDSTTRFFEVVSVDSYRKSAMPLTDLFTREGPPQLVIVTCGGPYDPELRQYRDNVVAMAVPVPGD